MRCLVLSVQLALLWLGRMPLVMRRWPAPDRWFASLWPRIGAPRRCQSPLGYEYYDVPLCRLEESPVAVLTFMPIRGMPA